MQAIVPPSDFSPPMAELIRASAGDQLISVQVKARN